MAKQKIGEILSRVGKLSDENVEQIIAYQEQHSVPFGKAALKLGFLESEDVYNALADQFDYSIVTLEDASTISSEVITATQPNSVAAETFRVLRSEIVLKSLERGRKTIMFTAPTQNCGCTYILSNLAVSLAQMNLKTCLLDANFRDSRIASIFGISPRLPGLSSVLTGRNDYHDVMIKDVFPFLDVLPAGQQPPNPLELLSKHELIWALSHLMREYDVVLIDSPPMNSYADARLLASKAASSVLVARRNVSLANDVKKSLSDLSQSTADIIGTVLNDY